ASHGTTRTVGNCAEYKRKRSGQRRSWLTSHSIAFEESPGSPSADCAGDLYFLRRHASAHRLRKYRESAAVAVGRSGKRNRGTHRNRCEPWAPRTSTLYGKSCAGIARRSARLRCSYLVIAFIDGNDRRQYSATQPDHHGLARPDIYVAGHFFHQHPLRPRARAGRL